MKLRVGVDHITASVSFDTDWTPELVETLLRACGDEVVATVRSLALAPVEDLNADVDIEALLADGTDDADEGTAATG